LNSSSDLASESHPRRGEIPLTPPHLEAIQISPNVGTVNKRKFADDK
jgi:hypothetical protein